MYKVKKKTKADIKKQIARYNKMLEFYKTKTLDELKEIFKGKLSSTDQEACIRATEYLMQKRDEEELTKKLEESNNKTENNDKTRTSGES